MGDVIPRLVYAALCLLRAGPTAFHSTTVTKKKKPIYVVSDILGLESGEGCLRNCIRHDMRTEGSGRPLRPSTLDSGVLSAF